MRLAALFVLLLSLCGCSAWVGPAFYSRNEAVNPFTPGRYRVRSEIGDRKEMTVRWDGRHLNEEGGKRENMDSDLRNMLAVPLPAPGRDLFIVQAKMDGREDMALYGVLERNGNRYQVDMPDCAKSRAIAQAAGATIESPEVAPGSAEDPNRQSSNAMCIFPDRTSLENALRRYAAERPLSGALIERVGD